ncbi:hypothetical protein WN944_014116 [Citrus x changshan-huyou]|uniref:T6J4.11 protein n=2 Tax=Citrus TaxID=2706 RepID=A0ACB8LZ45_CITSI|nr:T6J4.11 protein [Citrus sinensis]
MAELKIEDSGNENSKKRVRDELDGHSETNSPISKLARVDSVASDGNSDGSGVSSPEAKRIHDDLLNFLDEADSVPAIQDLDSVIRSFEEEILVPEQAPPVVTSDAGEARPELGFLLEASDDELGLPPSFSTGAEQQKIEAVDLKTSGCDAVKLDDMALGFENEMPSYEAYNFGICGDADGGDVNVSNDYITLGGGLFESYEPADISDFAWRPESLSAS